MKYEQREKLEEICHISEKKKLTETVMSERL